jgi:hypothetical protein
MSDKKPKLWCQCGINVDGKGYCYCGNPANRAERKASYPCKHCGKLTVDSERLCITCRNRG